METDKVIEVIITVISRILAFIPFLGIAFVGVLMMLIRWRINFIRFGGESIAYTDKTRRKCIQDVFIKLQEVQNAEKQIT